MHYLPPLPASFSAAPPRNQTITKIRRHHEYQAPQAAEDRDRERYTAKMEESRRRVQAMEAQRRRQQSEMDRAREKAALLERRRVQAEQDAAAELARAAADHERMRVEREAFEERARMMADRERAIAERNATEEETRRKEEEEARRKEEEATVAFRKLERETRELTRKLRQLEMEKEQKEQKEEKEKRDKERQQQQQQQQEADGGSGGVFGPLRWPTREEYKDAMRRIQYDQNKFHFAIIGGAGSGKLSLINAFRNLLNTDPGAAKPGTTETTPEIKRYPDPGTTPPRQWIVWYDVSSDGTGTGAGTGTECIPPPNHDYFVRQGLFVFDLVVLAIGDRFEESDVRMVEDYTRFQIPIFIMRSKADIHILNSMKEYGDYRRVEENPALYAKCRDEFIFETQRTVREGLARSRQKLPDQEVYIVSRNVLQRTYNGVIQRLRQPDWAQQPVDAEVIHERDLSEQLMATAAERWYEAASRRGWGGEGGDLGGEGFGAQARAADVPREPAAQRRSVANRTFNWVRDMVMDAEEGGSLISNTNGPPTLPASSLHVNNHHQRSPAPPPTPTPTPTQNRTALPAADERKPVQQAQARAQAHATKEIPKRVLMMIYPREPTDSKELFAEMVRNHPDIENMLVCKPRMFTPKAGLLTFYPFAPIPREVNAFGGKLRIKEYEVRNRNGGGEKKGGEEKTGGVEKKEVGAAATAAGQSRGISLPTFIDSFSESGESVDSSALERNAIHAQMRKGKGRGGY